MKSKKSAFGLMGKIGDILLIPIILLSLIVSIYVFSQQKMEKVPSVFGKSLVTILSGSMENSGFYRGDLVMVSKTDTNKIWEGDIIAFYEYQDEVDEVDRGKYTQLENVTDVYDGEVVEVAGRADVSAGYKEKVIFHQVIKVFYDESGERFFETKGSSNGSSDSFYVRSTFVVGTYTPVPDVLISFLKWLNGPIAIVVLVLIPLGILVIMQSLALIEQINFYTLEKRLVNFAISWDDSEVLKFIRTGQMEELVRIVMLVYVEDEDFEEVKNMLFDFDEQPKTKKAQQNRDNIEQGFKILKEKGKVEYLEFHRLSLKYKTDIKTVDNAIAIVENELG